MARLRDMMRDYACIGEVRGKGLMIGVELIENDAERTPARALCERLVTRGFYNGLLLLSCGVSTVRFMPPLPRAVYKDARNLFSGGAERVEERFEILHFSGFAK